MARDHEPTYGMPSYDDFFVNQLTELLTGYGPLFEVWLDGAHGAEVNNPTYDTQSYWDTIRRHQPEALIANAGPDVVGNEDGLGADTQWSIHDDRWFPVECDVSIRPHWFWEAGQDDDVKSLDELLAIYFASVGCNCTLLLNVPPT